MLLLKSTLVRAWVALPDLEDSDTCGHCKRGLHMPETEVRKHLDSVFDQNLSTAKLKLENT